MLDPKLFIKILSPKVAAKAVQSFDRATTVVVGACWGAAILMMAFAVYTTMISVSTKRQAENAEIAEPILPKIVRKGIEPRVAQGLVDRLKRLYPDLTFALANNQVLTVTAIDGSKFRQWLTALSYIDAISPQYHWTMTQFCVGKCTGNEIMRANLTGEQIALEAPQK